MVQKVHARAVVDARKHYSMKIRKLLQEEKASSRALYEEMFYEDSKEFVDYYYTEKTKDNDIYVCGEPMVSMVQLNPYPMMVNGREVETHYIVAVATKPAERRKGYMAALLTTAMEDMRSEGEPFTFLMPAKEAYYTPFGFTTVYQQDLLYVDVDSYEGEEVIDFEEQAILANTGLTSYQVYAKRSKTYYERLAKELASEGGKLLKTDSKISAQLCIPAVKEVPEALGTIMIRILDVKKMLELTKAKEAVNLRVFVEDPLLKENEGCYEIHAGKNEFLKVKKVEKEEEVRLRMEELQLVLFGKKEVPELSKICPLTKIYLNEIV